MKNPPARTGLIILAAFTLLGGAPTANHLSLDRLLEARHAVEEVYWRHRIWPTVNPSPKPSLDKVMSEAVMRAKVTDALRKSAALARFWNRPVSADRLQAEIDRMAATTRSPGTLRELFSALGNDPALVAETLARPNLADRLIRSAYARDERLHGAQKERLEKALARSVDFSDLIRAGGEPSEATYVRGSGSATEADARPADPDVIVLDATDWNRLLGSLSATFGVLETASPLPVGKTSGLQQDDERFFASVIRQVAQDRIVVASVSWRKRSFDDWWKSVRDGLPLLLGEETSAYRLPRLSEAVCTDDTWSEIHRALPTRRSGHSAVWTGSEMIVWGGVEYRSTPQSLAGTLKSGDRYNPATDTWTHVADATAPSARMGHTAVWTGTEMIIWGGHPQPYPSGYLNTGGRYNPSTDTWTATPADDTAPGPRQGHTAVWAGNAMIVWGGFSGTVHNDGGRYDPNTNTWTATRNDATAPSARQLHTAVWTGSEMIVWGGDAGPPNVPPVFLNTGGRYNPSTDTWVATRSDGTAPAAREGHTAVWTGSEMIVWGGFIFQGPFGLPVYFNTGGRYNPANDQWTATPTATAPVARSGHVAFWTGQAMIIWGGRNASSQPSSGSQYDPATDAWSPMADYPPSFGPRPETGVWTGSEMIVWGGPNGGYYINTGGRYSPGTNTWVPTPIDDTPVGRGDHTATWTGSEMIVWGGNSGVFHNDGSRYDPATDSWTPTRIEASTPTPRGNHTAVWTGTTMIVWGGNGGGQAGGRYDPVNDSWTPTGVDAATPDARTGHTAVWTGTEMIIWGGLAGSLTNTGGRYDPVLDTWSATLADSTAPQARESHTAVWTGTEMIVWGGVSTFSPQTLLNSGGRYEPATNSWSPTQIGPQTPSGRTRHSVVWTGTLMIVWGGAISLGLDNSGGLYDPQTNTWGTTSIATTTPAARIDHTAVWTGDRMILWGGSGQGNETLSSGGRYDPVLDQWTTTRDDDTTPARRAGHTAVWTTSEMIIWGGDFGYDTGGAYCVSSAVPPTDGDGDGILDAFDNCPTVSNPSQTDTDNDSLGDACDNCPNTANQSQANSDSDSLGDACDPCPGDTNNDSDADGICNGPTFNASLGKTGANDNCPSVSNPTQADGDNDGVGDACDVCTGGSGDADGDGVCDATDNCPNVANASQTDTDGDAVGDACDTCRYEKFNDQDSDGFCACDVALEWAGTCGPSSNNCRLGSTQPCDNCRKVANPDQAPSGYNDGLGDRCEDKIREESAGVTSAIVFPSKATGAPGHCSLRTCFFHRGATCNSDNDCAAIVSYDFCDAPRACFVDTDCKRTIQEGTCAGNDNGFGNGRFRFQTNQEWNCPTFKLFYRSAFGDRDTGLAYNCARCTDGRGFFGINTFYGTRAGSYLGNAHGGNSLILKTFRVRTTSLCPAHENPPSVVNAAPETAVTKIR